MAVDPDTVDDALTDLVANPKSVTTPAGSFTEHSLAEVQALNEQAAATDAVNTNKKTRGLIFNKISHRSTTGGTTDRP